MRIIELDPESNRSVESLRALRDSLDRERERATPGLHLSTICDDIDRTLYPAKFATPMSARDGMAYQEIGNVLEDVIAAGFRQRMGWHKPRPRACEGIWCSPDGESRRSRTIDEMKATWASAREFLESVKLQSYLRRILGYLYAWQYDRARLHVVFINGDYRPRKPMPPRVFLIRPTEREKQTNWKMLRTHAVDRGWLRKEK